jgi:hypothetical protein
MFAEPMGVCVTTVAAVLQAVGALGTCASDGSELAPSDIGAVVTALREVGSGLLAAEHPELVDGVVQAVLPLFRFREIVARLDFDELISDEIGRDALAFLASRAAGIMTLPGHGTELGDNTDIATSQSAGGRACPPRVFLGVLGEALNLLQTVGVLMSGCIRRRVRLADEVVAHAVFAAFRLQESCKLARPDAELELGERAIYNDARAVSKDILGRAPEVCKGAKSVTGVVARVWNTPRGGLHAHLVKLLKAEDKEHNFELKEAKLGLASCSRVLREMATLLTSEEDMVAQLSLILAISLPLAGDVNLNRRLDALAVVSHCLKYAPQKELQFHGQAIVSSLSQSLLWDDCMSSLASFPSLSKAMALIDQTESLSEDPPKIWKDALREALRNIVAHVEHRGTSTGEVDQAEIDEHLSTAAALSEWIPSMAKSRIIPHLELVMATLQNVFSRAARLVCNEGTPSLYIFAGVKNAFVETIRYAWPRVPAHFGIIFRGATAAVLVARQCEDLELYEFIMAGSVDVLVWASRCGHRTDFELLLNITKEVGSKYESLAATKLLCVRVEQILATDRSPVESSLGKVVDELFA